MKFKEKEIRRWLVEANRLVDETLKKIDDIEKHPKNHELGELQNLLYKLGYRTGHEETLKAILKIHESE